MRANQSNRAEVRNPLLALPRVTVINGLETMHGRPCGPSWGLRSTGTAN